MDSPSIKVKATATAQHLLDSVASMFQKFPPSNSNNNNGDSSEDSGTANILTSWGYDNENGPHTWSRRFPWAAGSSQSPVHIESGRAVACPELETWPLRLRQPPLNHCRLLNTGVGFQALFAPEKGDPPAEIEGGPLTSVYQFEQFHMHWGSCDSVGSEHAFNGRLYPAELHMVHWRRDGHADFNSAAEAADGLAVLATFVEIGEENPEIAKILAHFSEVRAPDSSVQLPEPVSLAELLPASTDSYFTYPGSLTTPPCFESVCWIVFEQPICMSREQLQTLRTLDGNRGRCPGKIVNNFRHLIPLGARTLRATPPSAK